MDKELLKMDGYNDCIMGKVSGAGMPDKICYNYEKVIRKNMDMGMTHEEAVEYFEYNQAGAYVGEHTPCFLEGIVMMEDGEKDNDEA